MCKASAFVTVNLSCRCRRTLPTDVHECHQTRLLLQLEPTPAFSLSSGMCRHCMTVCCTGNSVSQIPGQKQSQPRQQNHNLPCHCDWNSSLTPGRHVPHCGSTSMPPAWYPQARVWTCVALEFFCILSWGRSWQQRFEPSASIQRMEIRSSGTIQDHWELQVHPILHSETQRHLVILG